VSSPVGKYTEDDLARIASLWADKVTTAEIGRRLRISKNSVCRLARDARLRGDLRFPVRVRPSPMSAVVIVPAPPARGPFRVIELLAHHCRYAVFSGSERGDHRFCGEPRQANSPYCAKHHALCNPGPTHYAKKRA
jgi:hypothetical protein